MRKIRLTFNNICGKNFPHVFYKNNKDEIFTKYFFKDFEKMIEYIKNNININADCKIEINYIPEDYVGENIVYVAENRYVPDDLWILIKEDHVVYVSNNFQDVLARKLDNEKIFLSIGVKTKEKILKKVKNFLPNDKIVI